MTWLKNGTAVQKVGGKVDVSLDCCCCECGCPHLAAIDGHYLEALVEGAVTGTGVLDGSLDGYTVPVEFCYTAQTPIGTSIDVTDGLPEGPCSLNFLWLLLVCPKGGTFEDITLTIFSGESADCYIVGGSLSRGDLVPKRPDSIYCADPCFFTGVWTFTIAGEFCPCAGQTFTVTLTKQCP